MRHMPGGARPARRGPAGRPGPLGELAAVLVLTSAAGRASVLSWHPPGSVVALGMPSPYRDGRPG